MNRTRVLGLFLVACLTGCAAVSRSTAEPSPGSLASTTRVGSQGSVDFVTAADAWEFTQPPDRLRTVVLRTTDGGAHWRVWGIAPEPAAPLGVTETEVLMSFGQDLLRSSDGSNWTVTKMPGDAGTVAFLPDLRHGWLYGFTLGVVSTPSPASGKGGTTGKGGVTGKGGAPGKGAGNSNAGASPCQQKGCEPTALWETSDGGATWRQVFTSTFGQLNGTLYFWTADDGMAVQGTTMMVTHNGGATWAQGRVNLPPDSGISAGPTMFDAQHGILAISTGSATLITRTADNGMTWSAPAAIAGCRGCGSIVFADGQHWIGYSNGLFITLDGGQTWKQVTSTDPGKSVSDVELVRSPATAIIAIAPGVFASETTDWGAHWRGLGLPDIYPSYSGFTGQGGWTGP